MSKTKKSWLIPLGLIILSLVPTLAGIIRLNNFLSGGPISPENARFFTEPLAVSFHVISSLIFGVLGAFQFSSAIRSSKPEWHRRAGWLLFLSGIISSSSGLYLTAVFPQLETDGPTLFYVRWFVGILMLVCIIQAIRYAIMRKFLVHGAWMMRAYGVGMGAGTQVFTHLPWIFFGSMPTGLPRDAAMAAGWFINIAIVELILRKKNS
ncbi:MAG: DUF2306 domain-containing protein [Leptospiraceae bacterium]|nr:DUF2306 domain-containing protein [Leptospiraceae bacterium]